jgi:predicted metal-dependent hydrolase
MDDDDDRVAIRPRNVRFDWTGVPLHWVPGDPFASHVINVVHLLLPEGERWVAKVFSRALPLISDDRLREDVHGFIGQEAIHADAHSLALSHLIGKGLDARSFISQMEWLFRRLMPDENASARESRHWLIEGVAVIAAIEHFTAFLGGWILEAKDLDDADADPVMLDLLRWHSAEEVEHRSVAFDVFLHLDGRYLRRVRGMLITAPLFLWLWVRGVRFLLWADPTHPRKARWRDLLRTRRAGLTPGYIDFVRVTGRYLRPRFHPSRYGSTDQAVAYLATSPVARSL